MKNRIRGFFIACLRKERSGMEVSMRYRISKTIISTILAVFICGCFKTSVCAAEANEMRYGVREVVTVAATADRTITVTPGRQPEGGYRLPFGGSIYVNTGGGLSVPAIFPMPWGNVSTSVNVGIAGKESSIGGFSLPVPAKTKYYKAKINKNYRIERRKVDVYQYNEYKYTYYVSVATLRSEEIYVVEVS